MLDHGFRRAGGDEFERPSFGGSVEADVADETQLDLAADNDGANKRWLLETGKGVISATGRYCEPGIGAG